ncbi:MAG: putative metal-binding motif-containing protein [candidate division Zixibacteria bacterium]|nr:putative metal-binding motif-containing protein [candidate division Zixibacteria bacterium]
MHYSKERSRPTGVSRPFFGGLIGALIVAFGLVIESPQAQLYGDGSDGAFTVSGTQYLAKNMNYSNLTILAGAKLETRGYDVRVSGVLLNGGTITDSYSGGKGGNGGSAGAGGAAGSGNAGANGGAGIGGIVGAGTGGHGGGGGGGGGGTHDPNNSQTAYGGNGGYGGQGGTGGGKVRIYAHELNNIGVIHANGFPGSNGSIGAQGGYVSYTELLFFSRDLAGGGGGGGGGGNGGSGGTVNIVYAVLTNLGTVNVYGGAGGLGGAYGSGRNTLYASSGGAVEYSGGVGAIFDANGGNGGYGEKDDIASGNGSPGENGYSGSSGVKTFTQSVVCYVDADGDGFGSAADPGQDVVGSCGAGYALTNSDCDDSHSDIHPGATEIVADGIDQNCDGVDNITCYADPDGDGFGIRNSRQVFAGTCGVGYVYDSSDNCPLAPNPDQADANHDGIGDACCCVAATGNVDCDPGDGVDISDLSALIDNLFIAFTPLCCPNEANIDGAPGTDISDLSALIDYLFINFTPTAACR